MPRRIDTRSITTAALLAALIAGCALVTVPIGAVPGTLQVFAVVLTALAVPPATAALAVGTYLLAGAVGLPVFAGLKGGFWVLLGPTGGYLWGFLLGAVAGSWLTRALAKRGIARWIGDVAGAAAVVGIAYGLGCAQLALVTGLAPVEAFAVGVVPFVVPDVMKAAAAIVVVSALRRAGVIDVV